MQKKMGIHGSFLTFMLTLLLVLQVGQSAASAGNSENAFPSEMKDIIQKQTPFLEGMAANGQHSFGSLNGLNGLTEGKDQFPPFFGNQQTQEGQPAPQAPQQNQQFPGQMPGQQMSSPLEGCWVCQSGQSVLIMMFMNGMCGITANGQQVFGPYSVSGSTLFVQFSNGKTLNVTFSVSGNQLRLSNGLVLQRQAMQGQPQGYPQGPQGYPQGQPQGYPQGPQGYPQGQPQGYPQGPQGYPQGPQGPGTFSATTPLEGRWRTQLPNGVTLVFFFKGSQYAAFANGQMTERGSFTLQGNRLEYVILQGQAMGQRGVNTIQIQGGAFIMILPNGVQITFQRDTQ